MMCRADRLEADMHLRSIILTGFEPEIILSSARTVIKEFSLSNAKYAAESRKENISAKLREKLGETLREIKKH